MTKPNDDEPTEEELEALIKKQRANLPDWWDDETLKAQGEVYELMGEEQRQKWHQRRRKSNRNRPRRK